MGTSNKPAPPLLPPGTIISDPCLAIVPVSYPFHIYVELEICQELDMDFQKNKICEVYWGEEVELDPLPIEIIITLYKHKRIDFAPGQLRRFRKIISESPITKLIRKKGRKLGPGYFECFPVDISLKDYWDN